MLVTIKTMADSMEMMALTIWGSVEGAWEESGAGGREGERGHINEDALHKSKARVLRGLAIHLAARLLI